MQGLLNPLDKEELVHVIMRYRGLGEAQFYPFEHEGWVRNFFDGTW